MTVGASWDSFTLWIVADPSGLHNRSSRWRVNTWRIFFCEAEKNPKNTKTKTGKTRKKKDPNAPKAAKGATFKITYELAKDGLSIAEIAEKRGLVTTTVEGHIARGIEENELKIDKFMDEDDRETIEQVLQENPEGNSGLIYGKLKGQYSYSEIKMVQAHLAKS